MNMALSNPPIEAGFSLPGVQVLHGDCLEAMAAMKAAGRMVDSIVTDPPYGLNFMGKHWDAAENIAFRQDAWRLVYDVLPPGGYIAVFGGSRTHHRMMVAIEDAGFEIRDTLFWIYGSGFPKSLDVSKAIDKAAGVEREVVGDNPCRKGRKPEGWSDGWNRPWQSDPESLAHKITAPATPEAQRYAGFGTALKPAYEPIILARKPLDGTVAGNVLKHGTGALNIDACRVATDETIAPFGSPKQSRGGIMNATDAAREQFEQHAAGRWPSNILHDGSPEVLGAFAAFGDRQSRPGKTKIRGESVNCYGEATRTDGPAYAGDTGTAARFFPALGFSDEERRFHYCAKASRRERGEGNTHSTVKPLALMQWLARLITPPGGTVLDPFAGSGTTGLACMREGFNAVLIEREAEYVEIIRKRLGTPVAASQPSLFT